jgi:hypothetical protein
MTNYFPVVLDQASHQWLLGLPKNSFDSWEELQQAFIDNFIATCEQPVTNMVSTGYGIEKMNPCVITSDASRICASRSRRFPTTRIFQLSSKVFVFTKP